MQLKDAAEILYKIGTSGVLDTGRYKITIITELCVDTECKQGVIIDNYNIVVFSSRYKINLLIEGIKRLIKNV